MNQQMKLTLCQDVITGFSYSFTKSLLEALKKLRSKGTLFEDGEIPPGDHSRMKPSPLTSTILYYLSKQTYGTGIGPDCASLTDIDTLIKTTEAFLAIFEKEKHEG